jgi:NAD(P)-dependent dehydrogenase (short-subunit alcohol dehydrogenase family)
MAETGSRDPELAGKVAVVTGASRGIGRAIALAYAAAGARVVLASRKLESVEAVAGEIRHAGGEALAVAAHAARAEDVEAMVAAAAEAYGGIDVAVANAATNPHFGPLLAAEPVHWDKTFELNVKGYALLAQAVVPKMRLRGGGSIVFVASIAGLRPWPGLGVYSVSKAAVLHMTRVLAQELGAENIRVNAIAPGLIETRFSAALYEAPGARAARERDIPLGRLGAPDEVAGMAVYLAGPASAFTTGGVFVVDGGQSI